jgi:hypothetical protein
MKMPPIFAALGILAACGGNFFLGFSIRDQISDLSPIKYYLLLLYVLSTTSNLFVSFSVQSLVPDMGIISLLVKLILAIQVCSLLFRTTSSAGLKEGVENIETFLRGFIRKLPLGKNLVSADNSFSVAMYMFLSFLPAELDLWSKVDAAWKARGGKNGIKKVQVLSYVFISISLYKAASKAQALRERQGKERDRKGKTTTRQRQTTLRAFHPDGRGYRWRG